MPSQENVDLFNKENTHRTGQVLTLEYIQNNVSILSYCFIEYVEKVIKQFVLNPRLYVSLPIYNEDCWLKLSCVKLVTIQVSQMINYFYSCKRGDICGILGERYFKTINDSNSSNNCNTESNNNSDIVIKSDNNSDNNTDVKFDSLKNFELFDRVVVRKDTSGRTIWYINSSNIYRLGMMHKLPYKDFVHWK